MFEKESMRKIVKQFVDDLVEHYNFGKCLFYTDNTIDWVRNELPDGMLYGSGLSRIAIWADCDYEYYRPEYDNFVLKIEYDYEGEAPYNDQEVMVYDRAKGQGLDVFFAEIGAIPYTFVDPCDNVERTITLYPMEKVEVDSEEMSSRAEDFLFQEYSNICGSNSEMTFDNFLDERSIYTCGGATGMLDFVQDLYSHHEILGKKIEDLMNFIEDYDINDLHCGNWGWRNDEELVMTDYGGYGRW